MRIEIALKRQARAVMQLRDLFSMAESCGMPSSAINDGVSKIRATTLAKCPAWAHAHMDGYRAALNDSLYMRALMFGGFIGDVFYSTHRDRADYYETCGISPAEYADNGRVTARGHYWKNSAGPKPFFVLESQS